LPSASLVFAKALKRCRFRLKASALRNTFLFARYSHPNPRSAAGIAIRTSVSGVLAVAPPTPAAGRVSYGSSLFRRRGTRDASLWKRGGLTWGELPDAAWHGILKNDLIDRACELAFNFLLAFFPLLMLIIVCLDFAADGITLRGGLYYDMRLVLPPDASSLIIATLHQVTHTRNNSDAGKLAFGVLFWLYAGSAGMTQMMSTLNAAYEVPEKRSWIRVHLISIALTLAMSVMTVIALVLILCGGDAVTRISHQLSLPSFVFTAIKVFEKIRRPKSTVLFRRGDKACGMFVVFTGKISLDLGVDSIVGRSYGAGALVGLPSTLTRQNYSMTATVTEDAELGFLTPDALRLAGVYFHCSPRGDCRLP
jgi:hypothetical protein